jgi:hypothetical protein
MRGNDGGGTDSLVALAAAEVLVSGWPALKLQPFAFFVLPVLIAEGPRSPMGASVVIGFLYLAGHVVTLAAAFRLPARRSWARLWLLWWSAYRVSPVVLSRLWWKEASVATPLDAARFLPYAVAACALLLLSWRSVAERFPSAGPLGRLWPPLLVAAIAIVPRLVAPPR